MKKQQKRKKSIVDYLLTLVMVVAFGVFVYAGYNLLVIQSEYKEGEETYEQLQAYVQETNEEKEITKTEDEILTPGIETAGSLEAELALKAPITVDFLQLKEVNEDIVGWIYLEAIPSISYPIVQGEDNDYYLKHTVEGKRNSSASIFIDYRNMSDFSQANTIVYGHNMKNQSMFGLLKQYKKAETCASSPYIWILTPQGEYRYEIFSVREVGDRDDVYSHLDFQAEELKAYMEQMQSHSIVPFTHTFDGTEKMITLSTCTSKATKRCVVQAYRAD